MWARPTTRRAPGAPLGLVLAASLAHAQASGPMHVMIDAKCLIVYGVGEWLVEKHGERGTQTWRKLRLVSDPSMGEIRPSELTSSQDGDASQVGPLLGQIDNLICAPKPLRT